MSSAVQPVFAAKFGFTKNGIQYTPCSTNLNANGAIPAIFPSCTPALFVLVWRTMLTGEMETPTPNCTTPVLMNDDDIEALMDDYFINFEEILRAFYRKGLLLDELLNLYELGYLVIDRLPENRGGYQFPEDPVKNIILLRERVRKDWENPVKVISVPETRYVKKGQKNGEIFELRVRDAREGVLRTYTPHGEYKICFCQMCLEVKHHKMIEVNNILKEPKYYFPQLRLSLCLDSKLFEEFRYNSAIGRAFINEIMCTHVGSQGLVKISIGDKSITFTGMHLAEFQEILKRMTTDKRSSLPLETGN